MILTKVGNTTTLQPGCDGRQCRKEGPIIPELSEVGTRSNRKNESTTGRSEITEDYQNDTGYLWDLKTVISKNMEYELSTETTVVDSSLLSIAQSNSTNWNRSLFSNSTTNASDAMMDPHVELTKNWAVLTIIPIIGFVAMGNILVIMAVKMDHKLRSSTNYFLTSLAVADLLVALTVMPPSLVMIVNNYIWPFSDSMCGLWAMLDVCFSTSSILHLCMISLDRYLALSNPFRYNNAGWMSQSTAGGWSNEKGGHSRWIGGSGSMGSRSKMTKRVAKRIFIVWAVSIGIALPLPILLGQDRNNLFVGEMCAINIAKFQIYGSLVAFFLPLVVMFICYSLTIRTLRKQTRLVASMMGPGSFPNDRTTSTSSFTSRISFKANSDKRKATKLSSVNSTCDEQRSSVSKNVRKKSESFGSYRRNNISDAVFREDGIRNDNVEKCDNIPLNNTSIAGSQSSFVERYPKVGHKKGLKRYAELCFEAVTCKNSTCRRTDNAKEVKGIFTAEYTNSQCTLNKSDSDSSSDQSIYTRPVKKSPMLVRANIKLAKAVAKLPIKRASARRVSAAMKSRVIASITNEQRASKVLGMIFTLFCVFWCPFFITNTVSRICTTCNEELMGKCLNWFVWVGYVSSGVNPCVYTLFSRRFRDTFRKLVTRRYDEIGHLTHRFSQDRGGKSSSSRKGKFNFQYSIDSKDVLLSDSVWATGTTPDTKRAFSDNVTIQQHRRVHQHTSSIEINDVLDEPSIAGSRNNSQNSREQDVEEDPKRKWRTTWPPLENNTHAEANSAEENTSNGSTLSPFVIEEISHYRASSPQREGKQNNPCIFFGSRRRIKSDSSYREIEQTKEYSKICYEMKKGKRSTPDAWSRVYGSPQSLKIILRRPMSKQETTRLFRSESGEESEYDNTVCDDDRSEFTELRNRVQSQQTDDLCTSKLLNTDIPFPNHEKERLDLIKDKSSAEYSIKINTKTTDWNENIQNSRSDEDPENRSKDKFTRLDSGIGESIRNSRSF